MTRLTLINSNQMTPPIAPVALDYLAAAVRAAGIEVELCDLCLADDPDAVLRRHFSGFEPDVVGITFRNFDDCFLASGRSFAPLLRDCVAQVRHLTRAPVVLGGIGYALFPQRLLAYTGADFGLVGDGLETLPALTKALARGVNPAELPDLVHRVNGAAVVNPPGPCPGELSIGPQRDLVDNATYFRRGGQVGFESKRGCPRHCLYCPEPALRQHRLRLRPPADAADEFEALLAQGVDVLHTCDSEFNLPIEHARAVCGELIRRRLGERVRWYAYLAVTPFDAELADALGRAGCVGVNFTADAANASMLRMYGQPHGRDDLRRAVQLCRENGIAVMLDLMIGGPGETPETVAESIAFWKQLDPDCAGAALGIRIYPGTPMARRLADDGGMADSPHIRRRYEGPIDLFEPTFYCAAELGATPAQLVRELIGDDPRFFPPADDTHQQGDHNYNDNRPLAEAIAAGARGAYWDILRQRG